MRLKVAGTPALVVNGHESKADVSGGVLNCAP
jgi:hypothetical protein